LEGKRAEEETTMIGMVPSLRRLFGRPESPAEFEVWVAAGPGAPLFAEAAGLTRTAALATAARCRRRYPAGAVLVFDGAGAVVDPAGADGAWPVWGATSRRGRPGTRAA
jgi:hypothetical protein